MKKTVSLLFMLCLCLGVLTACGGSAEDSGDKAPTTEAPASEPAGEADAAPSDSAGEEDQADFKFTQTEVVSKEKYIGEEYFSQFLSMAQKEYLIPGLNEAAIPQGMSYSDKTGLLYISSYYKIDEMPSVISALDAESGELVAEYRLFKPDGSVFSSHVGGLAVTEDKLYVSAALDNDGKYNIAVIPLSDLPVEGGHDITITETVNMAVSPSFLNYSQGILWVGNFYLPDQGYELSPEIGHTTETADGESGCYILGFDMSREGALDQGSGKYPIPDYVLIAPDKIQGMTCTDDGRVLLSQSYGRQYNSALLSYSLDLGNPPDTFEIGGERVPAFILDSSCQLSSITAMPTSEALTIGPDGNVLVLFESGALAYSDGRYRTDHVWKMEW